MKGRHGRIPDCRLIAVSLEYHRRLMDFLNRQCADAHNRHEPR